MSLNLTENFLSNFLVQSEIYKVMEFHYTKTLQTLRHTAPTIQFSVVCFMVDNDFYEMRY